MGTPFLGEIKIVSFSFAPKGWALCNGQLLPINQNQALFALFGTTYGGNGTTTFALPNLQGRVPLHIGSGFTWGQAGGETAHTLTASEMPQHLHFLQASTAQANTPYVQSTTQNVLATVAGGIYGPPTNLVPMNPQSVANVGGNQAHDNMQPYLVLNFVVALQGVFPSRN